MRQPATGPPPRAPPRPPPASRPPWPRRSPPSPRAVATPRHARARLAQRPPPPDARVGAAAGARRRWCCSRPQRPSHVQLQQEKAPRPRRAWTTLWRDRLSGQWLPRLWPWAKPLELSTWPLAADGMESRRAQRQGPQGLHLLHLADAEAVVSLTCQCVAARRRLRCGGWSAGRSDPRTMEPEARHSHCCHKCRASRSSKMRLLASRSRAMCSTVVVGRGPGGTATAKRHIPTEAIDPRLGPAPAPPTRARPCARPGTRGTRLAAWLGRPSAAEAAGGIRTGDGDLGSALPLQQPPRPA
mmetsp:Transcript_106885/g.271404  ORF Transcript_106885/g.271404 Transcript_106885/m.271404 type:complete len:299 (+) Transcript_106885:225-1121(+)